MYPEMLVAWHTFSKKHGCWVAIFVDHVMSSRVCNNFLIQGMSVQCSNVATYSGAGQLMASSGICNALLATNLFWPAQVLLLHSQNIDRGYHQG